MGKSGPNATFVLCFRIASIHYIPPLARRRGGAEGNPGADLHPAPFQHPYTRKSTTTPSGVHFMSAGLPHYRKLLCVRMPFCSKRLPPPLLFSNFVSQHAHIPEPINLLGYVSAQLVACPGCFLKLILFSTSAPDTHCVCPQ